MVKILHKFCTFIKKYIDFWTSDNIFDFSLFDIEYIDLKTSIFEFFMMGLRKLSGISSNEFTASFNYKLPSSFVDLILLWQKKNLAIIQKENGDTRYKLTKEGILYLNTFLEKLKIDDDELIPLNKNL